LFEIRRRFNFFAAEQDDNDQDDDAQEDDGEENA
jgi:hypothetical protein